MAVVDDDRLGEARRLAQLLVGAAELAKADFADTVTPLGVPVHLARALLMLDSPAPMRELAAHLACDRSYVTGLADGLEERGLVTRVTGTDRRIKLLALTDKGEAMRKEISAAVADRSLLLNRLTVSQRGDLARLLQSILGEREHP